VALRFGCFRILSTSQLADVWLMSHYAKFRVGSRMIMERFL
jgi:hypothetical protein